MYKTSPIRRFWLSVSVSCAAAITLAVPATPASAAALWKTHVFTVSYDGGGSFSYTAQGANGDTGCHMTASESASYAFDQLWTVKIAFQSTGPGKYKTKVVSIGHLDGPATGNDGSAKLHGEQTALPDENCSQITILHNTGKYGCHSDTLKYLPYPKPQLTITRSGANLVFVARAFIDGSWKFAGTDKIPGDTQGCASYDDQMNYGSSLAPGPYASAKISLKVKSLAGLKAGKHGTSVKVSQGKNTDYKQPKGCTAVFGTPNSCTVHSEKFAATFQASKVK